MEGAKNTTEKQYRIIVDYALSIFEKKNRDYGTAWRILRLPSITDQIFIKAKRIRSIQEKQVNKVGETIEGEFYAIINYCIMALLQLHWAEDSRIEIGIDEVIDGYKKEYETTVALLMNKNHDYDEALREMRVSSMTDIILMKLFRTKQIEDNNGQTEVSEGVDANYRDMINYAVFCLILLGKADDNA